MRRWPTASARPPPIIFSILPIELSRAPPPCQLVSRGVSERLFVVAEADGILLLNRVKPHTDICKPPNPALVGFDCGGIVGSGLSKICAIGAGKLEARTRLQGPPTPTPSLRNLDRGISLRDCLRGGGGGGGHRGQKRTTITCSDAGWRRRL